MTVPNESINHVQVSVDVEGNGVDQPSSYEAGIRQAGTFIEALRAAGVKPHIATLDGAGMVAPDYDVDHPSMQVFKSISRTAGLGPCLLSSVVLLDSGGRYSTCVIFSRFAVEWESE